MAVSQQDDKGQNLPCPALGNCLSSVIELLLGIWKVPNSIPSIND